MSEIRVCKQCSRELPEERFRLLRGERKTGKRGRQHVCMDCDAINAKYRRLMKLTNPSQEAIDDIAKIEKFYKLAYDKNELANIPRIARERLCLPALNSRGKVSVSVDNIIEQMI